jgi:hypothetical protein
MICDDEVFLALVPSGGVSEVSRASARAGERSGAQGGESVNAGVG